MVDNPTEQETSEKSPIQDKATPESERREQQDRRADADRRHVERVGSKAGSRRKSINRRDN